MEKFWMVHRIGSMGMFYRHPTYPGALHEAERLARVNPGEKFIVLEAMVEVCASVAPVTVSPLPTRTDFNNPYNPFGPSPQRLFGCGN